MTAIEDCATAVKETFGAVFTHIDEWRSRMEQLITDAGGRVATAEVDALAESLVVGDLGIPGAIVIGAGFVAAPRFLSDTDWHLAWWLGHSNTFGVGSTPAGIRRLEAEEDERSESFRDYTNLEWWRVPAATGTRHITGPYVDYLCTDDYTLTLTVPTTHDGDMVGIVGADIYVTDIERMLLPRVRAIGEPASIVNSAGRVVVSTDPHRATGSLLRTDDLRVLECGDTGLRLALG
jgi:hypothetical protein